MTRPEWKSLKRFTYSERDDEWLEWSGIQGVHGTTDYVLRSEAEGHLRLAIDERLSAEEQLEDANAKISELAAAVEKALAGGGTAGGLVRHVETEVKSAVTAEREARERAAAYIAELEVEILQSCKNYCTPDWTDRGLHAPECIAYALRSYSDLPIAAPGETKEGDAK